MFNHILVPLDGSPLAERAIPHAELFARVFGGKITLLQVLDPSPNQESPAAVEPLNWQIRKAEADVYLQGLSAHLREKGISTEHALVEGRASENIVDYAHSQNVDLLILSTHGISGLSRWNISSVVTKVIEKVYLPILLVRAYQEMSPAIPVSGGEASRMMGENARPGPAEGRIPNSGGGGQGMQTSSPTAVSQAVYTPTFYHRILLPIDSSRRAECALPAAVSLARGEQDNGTADKNAPAEKATLILSAVIDPPDLPIPAPYPDEFQQLIDRFMSLSHTAVQNYLNELTSRVPVNTETRIVEADSISVAIHDMVDKENVDLVVLCAHGQTGHINWPYGSVARNYIEHGTKSVLVIQDVPVSQVRPTAAEIAAKKYGRR